MADMHCPVCKYDAENKADYDDHMEHSMDKPHRELMKEKVKNTAERIKDSAQDTWQNMRENIQEAV